MRYPIFLDSCRCRLEKLLRSFPVVPFQVRNRQHGIPLNDVHAEPNCGTRIGPVCCLAGTRRMAHKGQHTYIHTHEKVDKEPIPPVDDNSLQHVPDDVKPLGTDEPSQQERMERKSADPRLMRDAHIAAPRETERMLEMLIRCIACTSLNDRHVAGGPPHFHRIDARVLGSSTSVVVHPNALNAQTNVPKID